MWLRGWTEADLAELVCRVYVFTCVSPVPCGSGLVSSVPVVFKDFVFEGLLSLFRWFMGVHLSSPRSMDRKNTPCAALFFTGDRFLDSCPLCKCTHGSAWWQPMLIYYPPSSCSYTHRMTSLNGNWGYGLRNLYRCECKHDCKCIWLQVLQLN